MLRSHCGQRMNHDAYTIKIRHPGKPTAKVSHPNVGGVADSKAVPHRSATEVPNAIQYCAGGLTLLLSADGACRHRAPWRRQAGAIL
jgi:hypothetical protein